MYETERKVYQMTEKRKAVIALLMCLALMFAFAACGSKEEPQEESQTETTEETSSEYDIASNLQLAGGGDEKAIDTDYFTITLTHGDSWDYEVDSKTSITIYNVASREADCGGKLVSIEAYDAGNTDYEQLPSYHKIGEKDGKVYIAQYPSDVQYDFNNEKATEDYQAVFEEVQKINEGAEDSPLVLK